MTVNVQIRLPSGVPGQYKFVIDNVDRFEVEEDVLSLYDEHGNALAIFKDWMAVFQSDSEKEIK